MPRKFPIPDAVLIPVANRFTKELGKTAPYWSDHDIELVKMECGPDYAHVPLASIRGRCENLRKSFKLQRVNGHAPVAVRRSAELEAVMKSAYWAEFRQRIIAAWGGRCAVCYKSGHLEVHHRTYLRLGEELKTDVIPVCKNCHKFCDKNRRRESGEMAANALTSEGDDNGSETAGLFDATV